VLCYQLTFFSYAHNSAIADISTKRSYSISNITPISLRIKSMLLESLLFVLKITICAGRIARLFFLTIAQPFTIVVRFVFKHTLVPMYRIYLLLKKTLSKIFAPAKNKIIYPLLNKSTIHVVIAIIAIAVIANNIAVQETHAEEFGQKTMLASMVVGLDDIEITETAMASTQKSTDYFREAGVLTIHDGSTRKTLTTYANGGGDDIITTESSAALVRPGLAQTTVGQRAREQIVYYTIEGGDTVSTIAEKFNISTNTILWENELGARDTIKPGQTLTILPASGTSHQIKKNDTVASLAKKYNVDEAKILEYNQLADPDAIEIDQILLIPGGTIDPPKPTVSSYASPSTSYNIPPSASDTGGTKLLWPTTSKKISQYYKWGHLAIDIAGDYSSPTYAADSGRVEAVGWGRGYGNRIIIDHGNGIKTLYAHHSKMFVSVGDSVSRGQTIGMIGCTGWCTGPHVHFEVIVNGSKVNPLSYL